MSNEAKYIGISQLEKAMKAISLNNLVMFKEIDLKPLQNLPIVFEKALRTPGKGEYIKICVEKGALTKVKNENFYGRVFKISVQVI